MDAKRLVNTIQATKLSFNPRARDGREHLSVSTNGHDLVSIHAPVMDANY